MRNLLALTFYILGFSNGKKLSWEGIFNPWCGANIPFCLFTTKPGVSLLEARSICYNLKSRSWPAELGGESSKEFLTDYIRKHSLTNIILNAEQRDESWFWVPSNIKVNNFGNITIEGDLLLHDRDESNPVFNVVCMLACRYIWKELPDTIMNETIYRELTDAPNVKDCKDTCRKDQKCSSMDVTKKGKALYCSLYAYPYDGSLVDKFPKVTHYVINRTSKTLDRCFKDYDDKKAAEESIPLTMLIAGCLLIALIPLLLFYYKRKKMAISQTEASSLASVGAANLPVAAN